MPATAWTLSLSASFLSLVNAAAGSPWVSSMITSTFRPAIWLPISSRYIMKPFDMSLPTAAPPPVICVRKPSLMGPFCARPGLGPDKTRAMTTESETISFLFTDPPFI